MYMGWMRSRAKLAALAVTALVSGAVGAVAVGSPAFAAWGGGCSHFSTYLDAYPIYGSVCISYSGGQLLPDYYVDRLTASRTSAMHCYSSIQVQLRR
jgi:hypothetical protein